MMELLRIELFKIFKRPRTYIAFAVIALIILLIQVALKYSGDDYMSILASGVSGSFEIRPGEWLNGYLVCFIILNLLLVHVPILVALVAGDMISGEANMGTLRLLVSRPVSRTRLLLIKFLAAAIYTLVLLIWVAILALGVSMLMFGTNSMFVARETESNVIAAYDVLWRYGAAFLLAALGLVTVAALSVMLSAFAETSIGPIVATVSVLIILTILTELQIPFYDETIKPYLFTTHMLGWKGFFYVKGVDGVTVDGSINNLGSVLRSAAILVAYSAAFLGTAIWYFRKKNILS